MFANAYEGVKKIYKAEILALIASVLLLAGGVISVTGLQVGESTSSGEGLLLGGGLLLIAAAVLMIIAAVMNIIGVNRASRDESAFKNALIALLFGIAANILMSAFSNNPTISSIGRALANATEILASYYICTGIVSLADRLGNSDVSARGKSVRSILMGIWLTTAVLNVLAMLFGANPEMQALINVITVACGITSVIAHFLFIGLLGRAKNMLAK